MYINNKQFALDGLSLDGEILIENCSRVSELHEKISGVVKYNIVGGRDDANRLVLKVSICGIICPLCQNCLELMSLTIEHYSMPVIFNDEAMMHSALFDNNEVEDAILADSEFDVLNFLEDELILLIPIAPRHDECVGGALVDKIKSTIQPIN